MLARSMPNIREEAVQDQLLLLWRTLPVRGGTDPAGVLEDYLFALRGVSVDAVENIIAMLRRGEVEDVSKDFCPKAPKLGELARAEQRRIDLARAEERRRTTPRLTGPQEQFTGEHRAEMSFRLGLLSRSMRGERDSTATLYNLIPGAKEAAERKANEQRGRARREGRELIASDIGIDAFANGCRRRLYEAGTTWLWAAQEVWGPAESRSEA